MMTVCSLHRLRLATMAAALAPALLLVGCGTAPQQASSPGPVAGKPGKAQREPGVPVLPPAGSGRGGYYQDDGPGDNPPPNLMATPDAEVRNDPLIARANKEYAVFGKTYRPITDPDQPFVQRGLGTWYGKKFHGQRTSSGELYDMYKMTAAHPTLPIPSYARVTNLDNGNQVVVRVNDRGPFHSTRIIDVSYTAALKLGLLGKGSHELEVVRILPAEAQRLMANGGKGDEKGAPAVVLRPQAPAPAPQREPAQTAALLYPPPPGGGSQAAAGSAQIAPVVATSAMSAPVMVPAVAKSVAGGAPVPAASAAPGASSAAAIASPASTASAAPAAALPPATTPASSAATPATGAIVLTGGAHAPAGGAIVPAAVVKGGYYLQLGAYSKPENAEAARAKVAMESGLAGLEVVPSGSVLRLYGGPYATRLDAEQAIQSLPASLGLKPLVIQR